MKKVMFENLNGEQVERVMESEQKAENGFESIDAEALEDRYKGPVLDDDDDIGAKFKMGSGFALVLISLIALIIMLIKGNDNIPQEKMIDCIGSTVNISTFTDAMTIEPSHITTGLKGYNCELDIDVSDRIVLAFENTGDYCYLAYMSEDGKQQTEIIISEVIPDEIKTTLTKEEETKLNKENSILVKSEADGIDRSMAINNINNIGFVVVIQQKYSESTEIKNNADEMANTICECMLFSSKKDGYKSYYLNIDGIGILDLNQIGGTSGNLGIYSGQDGVIRIYDIEKEQVCLFISDISNQYIMCSLDNMEQVDGWNNLYYDKDKDDNTMMGYRGFGVKTTKGFYYMKAGENMEDNFEENVINWLGIQKDDKKI